MKRRLYALGLALMLILALAACGGNQKALVGTWELTGGDGSTYGWGIRFAKDGKFSFATGSEGSDAELDETLEAMQTLYSIEYKVISDTELELTQKILGGLGGKETSTVAYQLDGDTLILDGDTYTRVK